MANLPRKLTFHLLGLCAISLAACSGQPDGALLEVHADLPADVQAQVDRYRIYRVSIVGGDVDEQREVEVAGTPPDVFLVRSPLAVPALEEGPTATVRVQVLRFTLEGEEQVVGCAQETDVLLLEEAVVPIEVTLAAGDCP